MTSRARLEGQDAGGSPVRVLVTDAQERAAVAAIRCLAAAGFAVTAVAPTRSAPGLWSRGCTRRALVPDPREDLPGFVRGLEEVLHATRHDVLIPATDAALLAVAAHRTRLMPHVPWTLPGDGVVERALDKRCLHAAAHEAGLAPPETLMCNDLDDVRHALDSFGFPAVVKPSIVVRTGGSRLFRFGSRPLREREVSEAALPGPPPWLVQRWSAGPVMAVAGVAGDAGLIAAVATRYRRLWPPPSGDGSYIETVPLPPRLRDQVAAIVRSIGWRGIFQVELIEQGDRLAAVDFNPRPYGSMAIARAAGVPLTSLWAAWCRGERPDVQPARVGVRYRWGEADLRHGIWRLRRGHWDSVGAVVRPRREVTHAFFERHDPLPAVAHGLRLMTRALSYPGRDQDSRA